MHKPNWKHALATLASAWTLSAPTGLLTTVPLAMAQETGRALSVPAGLQDSTAFQSTPIQYLPFAHFAIPFDIDRTGRLPQEVHLWVSADQGKSWLKYASNSPDKRSFEFQAAAEGEYLFAVQTQDDRGTSALAAAPPMRILVDTTKPQIELKADINSAGRLVIDYRISERFLSEDSVRLSYAVDGRSQWEEIRVGRLKREGDLWTGQIEQEMPRCHEFELKLTASDLAQNNSESTARYHAPRTAAANSGMQLASQRAQAKPQTLGQRDAGTSASTFPTANAESLATQPTGPRAAASRVSQLALETSSATEPVSNQTLESAAGAIAWEPTTSRKSKPATTNSPGSPPAIQSRVPAIGRTVSNSRDAEDNQLNLSSERSLSTSPLSGLQNSAALTTLPYEELPRPNAIEDAVPVFQRAEMNSKQQVPVTTTAPAFPAPNSNSGTPTTELPADVAPGVVSSSSALNSLLERSQMPSIPYAPSPQSTVDKPATNIELNDSSKQPPISSEVSRSGSISTSSTLPQTTPDRSGPTPKTPETDSLPTIDNDAYHSRSRSFSLDYSIESLRGLPVADIELWGTDDRGNTWQKWGSDPDRESPFDVQVGTDGLYGFRMVIIGQNGLVSNRPNDGDPADMWINVDTKIPSVKITRALYGEGPDAGMLVIDYNCDDENLHDRPISLAYSERPSGPWSTIVTGLRNTGIYLWKADPSLPQQVYLRIQALDRAGNVQEHRLDLPINLRGLTPRGRIQGFRPIDPK